jgi:hypothetical protein
MTQALPQNDPARHPIVADHEDAQKHPIDHRIA